jgi:hypothetical protein
MTNNSTIFLPKRIKVGYQNRSDTYTGKLAYVIYYDEKNVLRKEKSWSHWRDESIPDTEYDNEPLEGFVINKKVGGVDGSYGWSARKTYCRVFDPRGFEIEITVPNLLWILENCNCLKGKGLEGEFVYGWDGTDLVLVPTCSYDYQLMKEKREILYEKFSVDAKDLKTASTYMSTKGEKLLYLGRYNRYIEQENRYWKTTHKWEHDVEDTSWRNSILTPNRDILYKSVNKGKYYYFMRLGNEVRESNVIMYKSVKGKILKCINDDIHPQYGIYMERLHRYYSFSPINYDSDRVVEYTYKQFRNVLETLKERKYFAYLSFLVKIDILEKYTGEDYGYREYADCTVYYDTEKDKFYIYRYTKDVLGRRVDNKVYFTTVKDLYDTIKPCWGETYLENKVLFKRVDYYVLEEDREEDYRLEASDFLNQNQEY